MYLSACLSHPLWYQLVEFSAAHSFPLSSTAGTFAYSEGEKDLHFCVLHILKFQHQLFTHTLSSTSSPLGLEDNHPRCYKADKTTVKHSNLSSSTWQHKLTVCGAEVSGTPLDLSPVWGTHTDLLIHIYTVSGKETITHCIHFQM